jgi:Holliday junction resolvase RusA-like endonuclease
MIPALTFHVPGNPRSWKRAARGNGRTYVDTASAMYRNLVVLAAGAARPDGWDRARRYFVSIEVTYPTRVHVDLDNVAKQANDALNGILWDDDSQLDELHVKRLWTHEDPGLRVTVFVLPDPPPKPKKRRAKR